MLHALPAEVTLNVLSHLPIPSLLSLCVLSRQWSHFFAAHQSAIYHGAAVHHEYTQPGTSLKDALSVNTGRPWAGSTNWKDFCRRSFQFSKNWEGKGRAVARMLMPQGTTIHRIKVDEKKEICITTRQWGRLTVTDLISGTILWWLPRSHVGPYYHIEYDDGYLVFDRKGDKEVWRLASDFPAGAKDEVALDAPPSIAQMAVFARVAEVRQHHALRERGEFRPWAMLAFPDFTSRVYRLVFPTLICVSNLQAFLHDVRTGSLVQTINLNILAPCSVDLSERHVFVCGHDVLHVFSRESGIEVLRVPACAIVRCSLRVEDPFLVSGDWFITPLAVSPEVDESPCSKFIAAHISRDGRDLVVLSETHRVVFIRDFERICRGETTFEQTGLVLGLRPEYLCYYLGFEHGRVCVATIHGLYVFIPGPYLSAKAVFIRPSKNPTAISRSTGCMQLTERRIYFTWGDAGRRRDIPLFFEDEETAQRLLRPSTTTTLPWLEIDRPENNSLGCIDFTLMPECYASEGGTSLCL